MPSVGSGSRVPPGGTTGWFLQKKSTVDFDYQWAVGVGPSKVTATAVTLGTQSGSQTAFTYYTVPSIAARGLVSLITVTVDAAGSFDLEVRGAGNTSGTLWLQAIGITTASYSNPVPWYLENDAAGQDLFVGIRNTGPSVRVFTLSNLRVEKFG